MAAAKQGAWTRGPVIGRGASATVSLASSPSSIEVFAVKSMELSRSALLQREQRILSALDCPGVISCLGFDITSDAPGGRLCYNLFLEYAAGGCLSDHIRKQKGGRLDEQEIKSRTREILTGLAHLHSQGLAHCDIKGQNILIGSDGRAKIADLGCARWVGDGEEEGGQVISGTPMFMAPEVARGEEQGRAADVWALGCTVVEMATGRPPWPDVSDPITALHRIAFSSEVPELPDWMSDESRDFADKCLRRAPEERWSAEELLKHNFLATESSSSLLVPQNRASPKSTLDHQHLWESLFEEEEEEDGEVDDASTTTTITELEWSNPAERIRLLQCGGGSRPSWEWSESETWVSIRNDEQLDEGEEIQSASTSSSSRHALIGGVCCNPVESEAARIYRQSQSYSLVRCDNDDDCAVKVTPSQTANDNESKLLEDFVAKSTMRIWFTVHNELHVSPL